MSSQSPSATAVIRGEPDGYDLAKEALMGRQAAGHGFLRAAVQARGERTIYGLTATAAGAEGFRGIVNGIDPGAPVEWIPTDQLNRIGDVGVLYVGDATVAAHARQRLRVGVGAFSLCGVTHTTASLGVMRETTDLLREPVMPWDALVCTSTSVIETLRRVHEAEADYLRWKFGPQARIEHPQLPLIPLGVHCDDFGIDEAARAGARQALDLGPDDIVGLFVGRLVFHAKAHPYPMLRAFQMAAERTGKPMALIFCGWFPHKAIEGAFRHAAARFAPDVKVLFVEGRDPAKRGHAWAAADMFVSLSDSIQETFGLTPIEAMAAGLPLIVSDWDGYKDTVRHGIEGFRVRTTAPAAGMGQALARALESYSIDYDRYCWATTSTTAVDVGEVADAVCALAEDPDLRRRLGEAGRRRAREVYDWAVVYRQYESLWAELNGIRAAARRTPETLRWLQAAPPASAASLDPYYAFGHYPTAAIEANSTIAAIPGATRADLRAVLTHNLFGELVTPLAFLEELFALLETGPVSVAAAATRLNTNLPSLARAAGVLMKIGVARLV